MGTVSVQLGLLAISKGSQTDLGDLEIATERATSAGHVVMARQVVGDTESAIRDMLERWIADASIDVVIVLGGNSDLISKALRPLVSEGIPGFADLFRWMMFQEAGASAMLSAAEAARCDQTFVFVIPGAVAAAMEKLILPQFDPETTPKNLVAQMPRLNAEPGAPEPAHDEASAGHGVPREVPPEKTQGGSGLPARLPAMPAPRREMRITGANVISRTPAKVDPPTRPIELARLEQEIAASAGKDEVTRRTDLQKLLPRVPPGADALDEDDVGDVTHTDILAAPPMPGAKPFAVPTITKPATPVTINPRKRADSPQRPTSGTGKTPLPSVTKPDANGSPASAKSTPASSASPSPAPASPKARSASPSTAPKIAPTTAIGPPPPASPSPRSAAPSAAPPTPSTKTASPPAAPSANSASPLAPGRTASPSAAPPMPPSAPPATPPRSASPSAAPMLKIAPTTAIGPAPAPRPASSALDEAPTSRQPLSSGSIGVLSDADLEPVDTSREGSDLDAIRAAATGESDEAPTVSRAEPIRVPTTTASKPPIASTSPATATTPAATSAAVARPSEPRTRPPTAPPPAKTADSARARPATTPPKPRSTTELPEGTFNYPVQQRRMHWALKLLLFVVVLGAGFGGFVFFFRDKLSGEQHAAGSGSSEGSAVEIDAAVVAMVEADAAIAIDAAEPEIEMTPTATGSAGSAGSASTGSATATSERPTVERPRGERPRGERPTTERPTGERPVTTPNSTPVDAAVAAIPTPPTGPSNTPPGAGGDDCDETACVLANYDKPCCAKFKPASGADIAPRTGGVPETLDKTMVRAGVNGVKPKVQKCGEKTATKGTVKVAMKVSPEGAVTEASLAEAPDPALGECVVGAMKLAKFGKSVNGASFTYPFVF